MDIESLEKLENALRLTQRGPEGILESAMSLTGCDGAALFFTGSRESGAVPESAAFRGLSQAETAGLAAVCTGCFGAFEKKRSDRISVLSGISAPAGFSDCLFFCADISENSRYFGALLQRSAASRFDDASAALLRILLLHFAFSSNRTERGNSILPALTDREEMVFSLLLAGRSIKEISYEMNITERTVKFHTGNIFTKCGVRSKYELILKYGQK